MAKTKKEIAKQALRRTGLLPPPPYDQTVTKALRRTGLNFPSYGKKYKKVSDLPE